LKILIVVNDLGFLISHRLPIVLAAKRLGHEMHVAYGCSGREGDEALSAYGFRLHFVPIQRGGTNPLRDLRSACSLFSLFRALKPDLVHLVTIKPVLLGGIAARLARVPAVVSAMAGLGFLFVEGAGLKAAILRRLTNLLFPLALGNSNQILIFQNPEDQKQVLSVAPVLPQRTRLIRGSGIDLSACPELAQPAGVPVVAMASRLLRDKGVFEFVQSARILRGRGIPVRFWLIGEPDFANPASITSGELAAWGLEGVVELLGHRKDVLDLYARAHIVTLPSYYGEGLPKCLIEAAACGRPVVTTDMPGCRDAIEPGLTGLLVPPRNALALANALERLLKDSALRESMGRAARTLAEREFGIEKVVTAHLQIYQELFEECKSR
jgi:glycosyltransferase involved in cell wall biosynthesis